MKKPNFKKRKSTERVTSVHFWTQRAGSWDRRTLSFFSFFRSHSLFSSFRSSFRLRLAVYLALCCLLSASLILMIVVVDFSDLYVLHHTSFSLNLCNRKYDYGISGFCLHFLMLCHVTYVTCFKILKSENVKNDCPFRVWSCLGKILL